MRALIQQLCIDLQWVCSTKTVQEIFVWIPTWRLVYIFLSIGQATQVSGFCFKKNSQRQDEIKRVSTSTLSEYSTSQTIILYSIVETDCCLAFGDWWTERFQWSEKHKPNIISENNWSERQLKVRKMNLPLNSVINEAVGTTQYQLRCVRKFTKYRDWYVRQYKLQHLWLDSWNSRWNFHFWGKTGPNMVGPRTMLYHDLDDFAAKAKY